MCICTRTHTRSDLHQRSIINGDQYWPRLTASCASWGHPDLWPVRLPSATHRSLPPSWWDWRPWGDCVGLWGDSGPGKGSWCGAETSWCEVGCGGHGRDCGAGEGCVETCTWEYSHCNIHRATISKHSYISPLMHISAIHGDNVLPW